MTTDSDLVRVNADLLAALERIASFDVNEDPVWAGRQAQKVAAEAVAKARQAVKA